LVCTGEFITASAATSNETFTLWTTADTDIINIVYNITCIPVDFVQEKIKSIFENRDKVREYRKSLFTEKIHSPSRSIKHRSHTIQIPAKRNFRGQEAQRK